VQQIEKQSKQKARADDEKRKKERESEREIKQQNRADHEKRKKVQQIEKQSKQKTRTDDEKRKKEREIDKQCRKRKRDSDPMQLEKERIIKRSKRENTLYRTHENLSNTTRKQQRRKDPEYREHEEQSTKRRMYGPNLFECIIMFHEAIKDGPVYICTCCQQTWFKESVCSQENWPRKLKADFLKDHVTKFLSVGNKEWLCRTCISNLSEQKTPKLSFKNKTCFPQKVDILDLQPLEERLIALRIPFMQIRELPRGSQLSLKGAVVNVPTDVQLTVDALPRTQSMMQTVPIKLKRKLVYRGAACTQNVRPHVVMNALKYLLQNSELYRDANISINESWLETFQQEIDIETDVMAIDDVQDTESHEEIDDCCTFEKQENNESSDAFDEDPQDQIAGNMDTLLDESDISSSHVISVAPGEGQIPINLFKDPDAEYLSFPCIYSGQRRADNSERSVAVHYSDICKWELRSLDRRAATSVPNLFFKMKKLQMKYITDKCTLAMRKCKTKGKKYTVKDMLNEATFESVSRLDEGYRIFRTIRGSPPYFESRKKDLFAMIRQLGLPTWFISLSAADTKWHDLLKSLSKLLNNKDLSDMELDNLTWSEKTKLVQSDPVSCVRYFDHRVQVFIRSVLLSSHEPLGKMSDYFYRVEFQQRGSPHIHMIIWIEGAPVFDDDTDDTVTHFIDQYVSCTSTVPPDHEYLVDYQRHRHSKGCRKKGKALCRFGFPHPPMRQTQILRPLETDNDELSETYDKIQEKLKEMKDGENVSFNEFLIDLQLTEEDYIKSIRSSLTSPKVFLKRDPSEIRINPYMKLLLTAWKANHDLQYIMDPYACAVYIVNYVSKNEKGMSALMRKACEEARDGNMTLREQVRHIGNKFLNSVEISAQEAAYLVLQLPITRSTRDVIFINTSPPEERTFLIKDKASLKEMPEDSTDIECSNIIDRYTKRPKQLQSWCLADYASKLNIVYPKKNKDPFADNKDDDMDSASDENSMNSDSDEIEITNEKINITLPSGIQIKERNKPRIIRYVKYSMKSDLENYCREKLLLFISWRNELKDLLGKNESYIDNYMKFKDIIHKKMNEYEKNAEALDLAQQNVEQEDSLDFAQVAPANVQREHDDESCPVRLSSEFGFYDPDRPTAQRNLDIGMSIGLSSRTEDIQPDILPGRIPDTEYLALVRSLNYKQRTVLKHILKHIKTSNDPLNLFITGGAGVGKSVLLTAIFQSLHRILCSVEGDDPELCKILICAPTGTAAHNVHGNTIHHAFNILPNRNFNYQNMTAEKLNTYQVKYRDLSVVMVDEISMVGNKLFNYINLRLQEIKKNKKPFGGVHIIVIGDLFQLKPVFDHWIFDDLNTSYGSLATNLWKTNFSFVELSEIMRQKDDQQFANILNRLREGIHSQQDISVLENRLIKEQDTEKVSDVIHVYPTNDRVNEYNTTIYNRSVNEKIEVKAIDVVHGDMSTEAKEKIKDKISNKPSETANLFKMVYLCIGLRYAITCNVDVEDGITNGAECVLKKIELDSNLTPTIKPKLVWVQFSDTDTGKSTRRKYRNMFHSTISKEWTPIFALKRHFLSGRTHITITRWQFPLILCAAKTIHKAQGSSVDKIVIDMTSRRKIHHLHYVAISRVRSLTGLHIINLSKDQISVDNSVACEMARLRNDAAMKLSYVCPRNLSSDFMKVAYLNSRSLHAHIDDIRTDHNLNDMDIFVISESRLYPNESDMLYTVDNFDIIRNDQKCFAGPNRPPHGLVVYIKNKLTPFTKQFTYSTNEIETTFIAAHDKQYVFIYKSPSCSMTTLIATFHMIAQEVDLNKPLNIIGDLNINAADTRNAELLAKLENVTLTSQIINESTTNTGSILDLTFTNMPDVNFSVIENTWSDHKIIYIYHK